MPAGDQPEYTASVITNETNTKVYYRTSTTGDWTVDHSLVFLGRTGVTNGYSFGGARFFVLEDSNDTTEVGHAEEVSARRWNASVRYRCNFKDGYVSPYYIKVTNKFEGQERVIFYGFINSVDMDLTAERATCNALSYSALLDQQQIYGGWRADASLGFASYYFNHVITYNPNGLGNKADSSSEYEISGSNYTITPTDDTLLTETETDANKFTVLDMITTVWARVNGDLDPLVASADNPWKCFRNLYSRKEGANYANLLIEKSALAKLTASYAVNNYTLQGKTIWGALSELVESVGGLALTEDIDFNDANQSPYVKIIDLKA